MNALKGKGGNEAIERLIDLVHDRPGIWDKTSAEYKLANKGDGRLKLFQEILNILKLGPEVTVKDLITAFTSLRTSFGKEKKKLMGKEGDDLDVDWPWFERLHFLYDVVDSQTQAQECCSSRKRKYELDYKPELVVGLQENEKPSTSFSDKLTQRDVVLSPDRNIIVEFVRAKIPKVPEDRLDDLQDDITKLMRYYIKNPQGSRMLDQYDE